MPPARPITETSKAVDEGIAMLAKQGPIKAAAFMLERGVPLSVIGRVLAPGARRRATCAAQAPSK